MQGKDDPYEILGVSPAATARQVRQAYRQQALKYHPDNHPRNPIEAARRFHRLNQAYHQVLRACWKLRSRRPKRSRPAQGLGAADTRPSLVAYPAKTLSDKQYFRNLPGARKLSVPTVNEPRIFICVWILAVIVSTALPYLLMQTRLGVYFGHSLTAGKMLILVGLSVGVYAAALGGILATLVLTRKVLLLLARFTQRGLPSPRRRDEQVC